MGIKCNGSLVSTMVFLLAVASPGAESGLVAHWSFEKNGLEIAQDTVSGISDAIEGTYKQPGGIVGSALKLDGYTTWEVAISLRTPTSWSGSDCNRLNRSVWN